MPFQACRISAVVVLVALAIAELSAGPLGATAPHTVILAVLASPLGVGSFVIFAINVSSAQRTAVIRLILVFAPLIGVVLFLAGADALDAATAAGATIPGTVYLYLLWQVTHSGEPERGANLDLLSATVIIAAAGPVMVFCFSLSTRYFNPIFDPFYVRIDQLFGAQPSGVAGYVFRDLPPLAWLCTAVYVLLPAAQALVAGLEARSSRPAPGLGILPGFVVTAAIGYVLYALMPAIGPLEYFRSDFPILHVGANYLAHRPNVDFSPSDLRGAMPSLHITWAALIVFATLRMRFAVRAGTAVFFGLTFLATLGLGMHYLIDLIVAAPLIVLVRAITAVDLPWHLSERLTAIVACSVLLGMWVVMTHSDIDVEAARSSMFVAMAATLGLPFITMLRLERARSQTAVAPVRIPEPFLSLESPRVAALMRRYPTT